MNNLLRFVTVVCGLYSVLAFNTLFGFVKSQQAFISSSSDVSHNGVTIPGGFEPLRKIGSVLVGVSGDVSDCEDFFCKLLEAQIESGKALDTCKSVAHVCQTIIASRLKSSQRLNVNVLVAGPFERTSVFKPTMFWLDWLGTMHETEYGAHGDDDAFILSVLDREFGEKTLANPDLNSAAFIKMCWTQLQNRSQKRISSTALRTYSVSKAGNIKKVVI